MTEKEHTISTDLATIRAAKIVLQNLVPGCSEIISQEEYNQVIRLILKWEKQNGDGGIDGKVIKDNNLYLVQAKRYSSAINPSHIDEFSNVIRKEGAYGGFFVHTGRTGKKSFQKIQGMNIEVISGDRLLNLIS